MALKALMLRKKIDIAKKSLEELRSKDESFQLREAELTKAIEEAAAEEATEEERSAVEEEVDNFEAEKKEHEEKTAKLESEIRELEDDIYATESEFKDELGPIIPPEAMTEEEEAVVEDFDFDDLDLGGDDDLLDDDF